MVPCTNLLCPVSVILLLSFGELSFMIDHICVRETFFQHLHRLLIGAHFDVKCLWPELVRYHRLEQKLASV